MHHAGLSEVHLTFSALIADRLNRDYAYLSRLFSNAQDKTTERFIIEQKVEKIKELLVSIRPDEIL